MRAEAGHLTADSSEGAGFFRSRWVAPPGGVVELDPTALAPEFRAAGVACGLKSDGGTDVGIVACDREDVASALLLTRNAAAAAPVRVCRERCERGSIRAAVVNSGNANAATSMLGVRTTEMATAMAGRLLGIAPASVLPCATGKIGVQVPRVPLVRGIRGAVAALDADGFPAAAEAINTARTLFIVCSSFPLHPQA